MLLGVGAKVHRGTGLIGGAGRIVSLGVKGASNTSRLAASGRVIGSGVQNTGSNEPTGMTTLVSRPFNAINELGFSDTWGAGCGIITDATAPTSPSNVLQIHIPAGMGEGGGPASGDFTFPTNYRTVYIRYAGKFSSNWQGPSSNIDKQFYVYDDLGHPTLIFDMDGSGFVSKSPMVAGQDIIFAGSPSPAGDQVDPFWPPNLSPSFLVPRGSWFTVEFVAVQNTAGTHNGSMDWWVNGTHVGSVSSIQFSAGSRLWALAHYTLIYTGTVTTTPASAQDFYFDHFYISGK